MRQVVGVIANMREGALDDNFRCGRVQSIFRQFITGRTVL